MTCHGRSRIRSNWPFSCAGTCNTWTTTIGRAHDCDICIPLPNVSRQHCQIQCRDGVLYVRDLGSRNGTYHNRQLLNEEAVLEAGDTITIGALRLSVVINGEPSQLGSPTSAEWRASERQTSGTGT